MFMDYIYSVFLIYRYHYSYRRYIATSHEY